MTSLIFPQVRATAMCSTWLTAPAMESPSEVSKRMIIKLLLNLTYRTCRIRWQWWRQWAVRRSLWHQPTIFRAINKNIKPPSLKSQARLSQSTKRWLSLINLSSNRCKGVLIRKQNRMRMSATRTKTHKANIFTWVSEAKWNRPWRRTSTKKTRRWQVVSSNQFYFMYI